MRPRRTGVRIGAAAKAAASIAIVLSLGTGRPVRAQQPAPCDVFCHSRLAAQAEAAGDVGELERHVRAVAALAPSHPGVAYQLARLFARRGLADSAVAALTRLGRMGDTRDPGADTALASLRHARGFADARNRLLANRLPVLDGALAFELGDPDFLPEALAYDASRERFLIGSLTRRVISETPATGPTTARTLNAVVRDRAMLRVVGIHVDDARGRLWFATWAPDSTSAPRGGETPSVTRLFLADLATGRVVRSWAPDRGRPGHLLNDFVVMRDGSLYITDTERGTLYRLRSPDDTLEVFVQPDVGRFSAANGITASPDERSLYVAFLEGIARLDLASRDVALVAAPDSVTTASIDGLYWHRGSLLAVQGLPTLQRVVRFALSADGTRIEAGAVLERDPAMIREPTTGVIVGSRFYYIANSQYGRLSDSGGPLEPQNGPTVRTSVRVIDLRW